MSGFLQPEEALEANYADKLAKVSNSTKVGYKRLVTLKQKNPFRSQQKRLADCELESHEAIDCEAVYLLPFKNVRKFPN